MVNPDAIVWLLPCMYMYQKWYTGFLLLMQSLRLSRGPKSTYIALYMASFYRYMQLLRLKALILYNCMRIRLYIVIGQLHGLGSIRQRFQHVDLLGDMHTLCGLMLISSNQVLATVFHQSLIIINLFTRQYSAPNKESTFSEILISAVKSIFSYSNHHKSIKELFWRSFLKICFSPYITYREAIEVQKQFLGKLSKFQQNEQYLRICMELRFQIWSTHTST